MSEKQKRIENMLKPVIKLLDAVPYGERIESNWNAPEGYKFEKFEVSAVPIEHIIPISKKTDKIVLQLHGGGYVVPLIDCYRDCAIEYSKMAGDAEVFSIDYRVAPTNMYPSALDDAVEVYKYLLNNGYDNNKIIIVGDSAGGNLVLSLTLYLKDNNIDLPKAVIAISPWADLEYNASSRRYNKERDLILGSKGLKMRSEVVHPRYIEEKDIKNPYISPIYGDYTGFPDLLVQVGSYEVLLDDSKQVISNAKLAGVNVSFTVYKGMSHDFQLLLPKLDESKEAWQEMSNFIKKIFK